MRAVDYRVHDLDRAVSPVPRDFRSAVAALTQRVGDLDSAMRRHDAYGRQPVCDSVLDLTADQRSGGEARGVSEHVPDAAEVLENVPDDEDEDQRLKESECRGVIPLAAHREQDTHGVDRDVGDPEAEDQHRAPGEVEKLGGVHSVEVLEVLE